MGACYSSGLRIPVEEEHARPDKAMARYSGGGGQEVIKVKNVTGLAEVPSSKDEGSYANTPYLVRPSSLPYEYQTFLPRDKTE